MNYALLRWSESLLSGVNSLEKSDEILSKLMFCFQTDELVRFFASELTKLPEEEFSFLVWHVQKVECYGTITKKSAEALLLDYQSECRTSYDWSARALETWKLVMVIFNSYCVLNLNTLIKPNWTVEECRECNGIDAAVKIFRSKNR